VVENGATNLVFPSTSYGIEDEIGWGVIVLSEDNLISQYKRTL